MDDDQSMRDRLVGPPGQGDQAGALPRPPAPPGSVSPPGPVSEAAGSQDRADQDGADRHRADRAEENGTDQNRADENRADQSQAGQGPAGPGQSGEASPAATPGRARSRSFWRELPVLIVVALVIALVIKTFVVQAFFIPSSSMEDTLLIGDKVLVNKIVYHVRSIHPGDIVVFNGAGSWDPQQAAGARSSGAFAQLYDDTLRPLVRSISGLFGTAPGQTDYIKRVIGVPGDHVACCNSRGEVTVNGIALHERSYLYPDAAPSEIKFSITVPPGRLWVMGDNRLVSDDSRLHTGDPGRGTIPENKVIGRAFLIVWPPDRWRVLRIPSTFGQPGITRAAAAAVAELGTRAAPAVPYLPLAGGIAVALPVTWLQRRVRLRRRRAPRRR